jgi:hypothetical protein
MSILSEAVRSPYKTEKEILPEPLFSMSQKPPVNETRPSFTTQPVWTELRRVGC